MKKEYAITKKKKIAILARCMETTLLKLANICY